MRPIMRVRQRSTLITAIAAMSLILAAPSVAAQDVDQDGLVNVNVGAVTIQLPLALAANVCDVNVNILAEQLRTGGAECDVDAESDAVIPAVGNGSGDVDQDGFVNVNVGDVILQLPVAVAANVCDVNVNVLARQLRTGDAMCRAAADSEAS